MMASTSDWSNLLTDLLYLVLDRLSLFDKLRFRAVCPYWCYAANTHIIDSPNFIPQPRRVILRQLTKPKPCPYSLKLCLVSRKEIRDKYYYYIASHIDHICVKIDASKVVLLPDPILSRSTYGVVAVRGPKSGIFYYLYGENMPKTLVSDHSSYWDIISDNNSLFALGHLGSIEGWEFRDRVPIKTINILSPLPPRFLYEHSKNISFTTRCYLVKSQDEFFLAVRYIEMLGTVYSNQFFESGHNFICPLLGNTFCFQVFKLKIDEKSWVKTDTLEDRILLLGGNQSIFISSNDFKGYEKESIYFSDDCWEYKCDLHHEKDCDTGVFNLTNESIKFALENYSVNAKPPCFWVVPHFNK